jgi:hypothetical protein
VCSFAIDAWGNPVISLYVPLNAAPPSPIQADGPFSLNFAKIASFSVPILTEGPVSPFLRLKGILITASSPGSPFSPSTP